MKKFLSFALFACFAGSLFPAYSADTVQPQSLSGLGVYRDVTSTAYSTNTHYTQGASFLFTNMVAYSTAYSTNPTIQQLDSVTVQVAMSTSSSTTGTWVNGSVQVATSGTWCATITTLPSASAVYWQLRLTDAATNTYYYQQQVLYADPHL